MVDVSNQLMDVNCVCGPKNITGGTTCFYGQSPENSDWMVGFLPQSSTGSDTICLFNIAMENHNF